MNCRTAVELLPWLLNGSLDEGEHREVLEHLKTCEDCSRELAETRDAGILHQAHPEADQLRAYLDGGEELPTAERETIRAHLLACPSCQEDLSLLRESWERLGATDGATREHAAGDAGATVLVGPWGARQWRRLALAASLVAALLAAAWISAALGARSSEHSLQQARQALDSELDIQRGEIRELEQRLAELSRRGASSGGPGVAQPGEEAGSAIPRTTAEIEQIRGELTAAQEKIRELEARAEGAALARVSVPLPLYAEQAEAVLRGAGGGAQGEESLPAVRRADRGAQTLQLLTTESLGTGRVIAELVDPKGEIHERVVVDLGPEGSAGGELILTLYPAGMAPGTWRVRLLEPGSGGGRQRELALFGFRVVE